MIRPQVYTLHGGTEELPERIVYQGTGFCEQGCLESDLDKLALFSVGKDTQVRAFIDSFVGRSVAPTTGDTVVMDTPNWQADLNAMLTCADGIPSTSTLHYSLTSATPLAATPVAHLCSPDRSQGCYLKGTVSGSDKDWQITFENPDGQALPRYGVVRVLSSAGELINWYQLQGGVGPAHSEGDAPLRDGLVTVDPVDDMGDAPVQVVVMPAQPPIPITDVRADGFVGMLGTPYDIDIVEPGCELVNGRYVISLFYSRKDLDALKARLGLEQVDLVILRFDRDEGEWFEPDAYATALQSDDQEVAAEVMKSKLALTEKDLPDHTWVSTPPVERDGIYAIGVKAP
jgi:hypothetical protein